MFDTIVYNISSIETDTLIEIKALTETIYSGTTNSIKLQTRVVTPSAWIKKEVVPTKGYGGLDKVIVNEIPYSEVSNPFGTTCIIEG